MPTSLPEALQAISPLVLAAVLLVARTLLVSLALPCPSVEAILTATGASRSRAYELSQTLIALLPTLQRRRGRPATTLPAQSVNEQASAALTREALRYVMHHPGCVDGGHERQSYSDGYRRFVLELREKHADIAIESFAFALGIPLGTLKDWLRVPSMPEPTGELCEPVGAAQAGELESLHAQAVLDAGELESLHVQTVLDAGELESLHVQTVLDAWTRWHGSFLDFCEHVKRDLLVPFGRDLVRRILEVHGQRTTARRKGHRPDELALRGAFRTYFAGAQWVGDGMQVPVIVDEQRFVFNLELNVDAHTAALVGVSVRDEEDSAAVIDAYDHGVITTGAPPLALLLDNRPSNHTPEVDAALGDTMRIRATPERPQNKAHVEGTFGLFSQILPPLVLDTRLAPQQLAGALLTLVAEVWARTTNHRPRRDRSGNSRVDLYAQTPTPEQVDDARRALRETLERQQRARRTLEARRRPDVLALLDQAFAELELLDPERHVRLAIAGYPRDAIVSGIAIFRAKKRACTLPDGIDARYLLGIVKNITAKTEGEFLAEELYDLRMQMRERIFAPLIVERDALRTAADLQRTIATCVDRALDMPPSIERRFWLEAVAEDILAQPIDARRTLFLSAARRIEATFAVEPKQPHDAVRFVAERIAPLD